MISYLFNEIFFKPLFNGLMFLYNTVPGYDMGLSIIILTVIIRLILWPLNSKSIKNQKLLAELQPKIDEIRKQFKNDKETQAKALMNVYKENKINPLAGFLPIVIQIPIIIALYRVFLNSSNIDASFLYSFIQMPTTVHVIFLGLVDLTKKSLVLAILSGVLQYFQTKMILSGSKGISQGTSNFGRIMSQQMLYFGPIISIVIFGSLPAALPLYWIVVTLMTLIQQYFVQKNQRGNVYDRRENNKN